MWKMCTWYDPSELKLRNCYHYMAWVPSARRKVRLTRRRRKGAAPPERKADCKIFCRTAIEGQRERLHTATERYRMASSP